MIKASKDNGSLTTLALYNDANVVQRWHRRTTLGALNGEKRRVARTVQRKKTQKILQHHRRTVGQRGGRRSTGGPRGGVPGVILPLEYVHGLNYDLEAWSTNNEGA